MQNNDVFMFWIYISTISNEHDIGQLIIQQWERESIGNGGIQKDLLITLWKTTFSYRRLFIRSHTINEILEKFPSYTYSDLVKFLRN
jgi:hypothetical protein